MRHSILLSSITLVFGLLLSGCFMQPPEARIGEVADAIIGHESADYALAEAARQRNEPPFVASELELAADGPPNQVGQWGPVVTWPFVFASAATLPDGRILAWGGDRLNNFSFGAGSTSTYAATWNPRTGTITSYNRAGHAMFCGIPTMDEQGRVFVVGGDGPGRWLSSRFDFTSSSWAASDKLSSGRWYNTSVQLPSGEVFTALGIPGSRYPEVWREGEGWRYLNGIDLQRIISQEGAYTRTSELPQLTLAPSGEILHIGPTPEMFYMSAAGNGSVREAGTGITGWDTPNSRGTTVMYDKGKLLTLGGRTDVSGKNRVTMVDINGATPTVTAVANMNQPRAFANAVPLPNGEVFVVGGHTASLEFSDVGTILTPEIWNPTTKTWRSVANHSVPRNYHSVALLMPDARVFSGGGGLCACNADHPDHQIYSPPYLFNADGSEATRPVISSAPAVVGYGANVTVQASSGVARFTMVKMSGTTHAVNTDQRFLNVPFTGSGSYRLTLEQNPNVLTPGYWMLFALSAQGTPSVAKLVQVKDTRPRLTVPGAQRSTVGGEVDVTLEATDPENKPLTFSVTGLPPGLSASNGRVTGVPTQVGTYRVQVTVSSSSGSVSGSFSWKIEYLNTYRFLRLEALSEVSGGPWASLAELNVLDRNGQVMSRSGWTVSASSASSVGPASYALDGNPSTMWHSNYSGTVPKHPHTLTLDMKAPRTLGGLKVLPRQTGNMNGTIKDYQVYVSNDGVNWVSPVLKGQFAGDRAEKTVLFTTVNVALAKPATQSSTYSQLTGAERALDGNLNGAFAANSLTHTNNNANAWWEVDLGQSYNLSTVRLWNRTDAVSERLSNFWVLVSDEPFTSQDLNASRAQAGVTALQHAGTAGRTTDFTVNRSGRYLRVQLAGTNYLTLVEVEVFTPLEQPNIPLVLNPVSSSPKPSGAAVSYSANYSGGKNPRFKWLFGDGTAETAYSTSPTVSHTFSRPGSFVVTLTATDDTGVTKRVQFTQAVYAPTTAGRPASSSSIVYEDLTTTDRVWTANPDSNTVSVIDAASGAKLKEIAVGRGPRTLAQAPSSRIWVTNRDDATVSVIDTGSLSVVQTITLPVNSQPFGIVAAPGGEYVYVVLEATGRLLKVSTSSGGVTGTLSVGANPRHLSVSADGSRVYVSRFVTSPVSGEGTTAPQVSSGGGEVIVVSAASMSAASTIRLQHSTKADTERSGRGLPNYLGPAVISPDGLSAWVPSKQDNIARGLLRDGRELSFDSTVRAISSRIDLGANREDYPARIDHDNSSVASNAAFDPTGNYLFVALETSREVGVIDAYEEVELGRISVGRAPQGLTVSPDGLTLYVQNFMDRTLSVIDISRLTREGRLEFATRATTSTVASERLSTQVLQGKRLFYDARDPRLAREGYMSCASCHNDGGEDGRVWDFGSLGEGLRNTVSLRGRAGAQGPLHWSANFDEVQDFEGQIRTLAGGTGLMSDADFSATQDTLGARKTGRSSDLDALAAYVASLSTVPPSPYRNASGSLTAAAQTGKTLFASRCASCHTGSALSDSGSGGLHDVGTLKPGSGSRLGGSLTGLDTPGLRGVWASAPYLHDGSAPNLQSALTAHQTGLSSTQITNLVAYLQQVDARD